MLPSSNLIEQIKLDNIGHRRIAGIVGVQIVFGKFGKNTAWVDRVLHRLLEIDNTIELAAVANEGIDFLPYELSLGREVGCAFIGS